MHAMILQASSQSKAGCMCPDGIPILSSIARLAGFISLKPFAKRFSQSGAGRRLLPSKLARSAISLRELTRPRISSNEALFKASN
jgi:hypothetical protein